MMGLRTLASVAILGAFYGYFSGVYTAMEGPLVATLARNPSELGGWMGIYFFLDAFGSLLGPPISGVLLASRYIWWKPALFAGISLTGAAMYGFMRLVYMRLQKNES